MRSLKKTSTCVECATVADCHWLPQWLYVEGTCDHVLRFERLAEDFDLLMRRFEGTTRGTKTLAAAVRNANASLASGCTSLTKHDLDETSRALLSSVYEYDFEMFGYAAEFGALKKHQQQAQQAQQQQQQQAQQGQQAQQAEQAEQALQALAKQAQQQQAQAEQKAQQ